jgi:hypothetical protein
MSYLQMKNLFIDSTVISSVILKKWEISGRGGWSLTVYGTRSHPFGVGASNPKGVEKILAGYTARVLPKCKRQTNYVCHDKMAFLF